MQSPDGSREALFGRASRHQVSAQRVMDWAISQRLQAGDDECHFLGLCRRKSFSGNPAFNIARLSSLWFANLGSQESALMRIQ